MGKVYICTTLIRRMIIEDKKIMYRIYSQLSNNLSVMNLIIVTAQWDSLS